MIAAIAAFILLGFVLFSAPGHDDSHVTCWAAHTLKEHGQLQVEHPVIVGVRGARARDTVARPELLTRDARALRTPAR
ncbi:hypothetical protein WMF20_02515 [Sorangium sp. So ce834]|uniref:hypothetical protein n=1 Tax=Sorangium sp. So ce834 TaxID=3133321 RepID=UPI003F5DE231